MAKVEPNKIKKMFDYLYNPTPNLRKANGTIVFGRWDPLLAKRAAEIYKEDKTGYFLFTGGVGKDSGYLSNLQIPEAKWQAALANVIYGVPPKRIYVEPNAQNGGENCRFSIDKIAEENLSHENIILLTHPTSLRRLRAVMEPTALEKKFKADYQNAGSNYKFNSNNTIDQQETVAELLRLADWPAKGWCSPQKDLPEDLVEYAREIKNEI